MSVLNELLLRMFGHPRGALGRLGGRIMARSNAECGFWVSDLLQIAPNDGVLEVGFGPGVITERLTKLAPAGRVAGVDQSIEMVELARARNITTIQKGGLALQWGALRSDLIDPTISVHHGRVVTRTGDGALVEFRSVVDAVRCVVEVQNGMIERNAGLPPERRIDFRIGIHLGDIVEESDGDLMSDGVNIAARLEGIAKPGAICLSEDAYRQVKTRLNLAVSDLGATQLKNIVDPIRVYLLEVGVPTEAKPAIQNQRYCFSRPGPLKTNFSPGCPGSSGPFVICALQASHNLIISGPQANGAAVMASAQALSAPSTIRQSGVCGI